MASSFLETAEGIIHRIIEMAVHTSHFVTQHCWASLGLQYKVKSCSIIVSQSNSPIEQFPFHHHHTRL